MPTIAQIDRMIADRQQELDALKIARRLLAGEVTAAAQDALPKKLRDAAAIRATRQPTATVDPKQIALDLIAKGPTTKQQLRAHLQSLGLPSTATRVVGNLVRYKLIKQTKKGYVIGKSPMTLKTHKGSATKQIVALLTEAGPMNATGIFDRLKVNGQAIGAALRYGAIAIATDDHGERVYQVATQ